MRAIQSVPIQLGDTACPTSLLISIRFLGLSLRYRDLRRD